MQRCGMIKRCFTGMTVEKICILYKSVIRPLLEYGAPVWSPLKKTDIDALEKVQRRCLKLCNSEIELESLESRRSQTDLNETYKYRPHAWFVQNRLANLFQSIN